MSLIFCPNCNGKLSDSAIICPHCHLTRNELFPKDSIDIFDININTKLIHKTLGNCIVTQVYKNSFSAKFNDGTERKFLIAHAVDFFKNVYIVMPYKESVDEKDNVILSDINNKTYYFTEETDYDPSYDMETDIGPDDDMETYEYYYGDDEIVGNDEWY